VFLTADKRRGGITRRYAQKARQEIGKHLVRHSGLSKTILAGPRKKRNRKETMDLLERTKKQLRGVGRYFVKRRTERPHRRTGNLKMGLRDGEFVKTKPVEGRKASDGRLAEGRGKGNTRTIPSASTGRRVDETSRCRGKRPSRYRGSLWQQRQKRCWNVEKEGPPIKTFSVANQPPRERSNKRKKTAGKKKKKKTQKKNVSAPEPVAETRTRTGLAVSRRNGLGGVGEGTKTAGGGKARKKRPAGGQARKPSHCKQNIN